MPIKNEALLEKLTYAKYQTFGARLGAGIIDSFVFFPVALIDIYFSTGDRNVLLTIAWTIVSYSCYWLYSVILHARSGQTLGKLVTGVKVLDLSETHIPTLRQAFFRDSGYIVLNIISLVYAIQYLLAVESNPTIVHGDDKLAAGDWIGIASLSWFLLEIITMITNKKRRALHDYIAGTVVVSSWK